MAQCNQLTQLPFKRLTAKWYLTTAFTTNVALVLHWVVRCPFRSSVAQEQLIARSQGGLWYHKLWHYPGRMLGMEKIQRSEINSSCVAWSWVVVLIYYWNRMMCSCPVVHSTDLSVHAKLHGPSQQSSLRVDVSASCMHKLKVHSTQNQH